MKKIANIITAIIILFICIIMTGYSQIYTQHASPVEGNEYWTTVSGLCTSCAVNDADLAANSDLTDYTSLVVPADVTGSVSLRMRLSSPVMASNFAGLKVERLAGLLDASVSSSITINTYMDGTIQESFIGSSDDVYMQNLGMGNEQKIYFTSNMDYNEIEIVVTGLSGASNDLRVFYGYGDSGVPLGVSEISAFTIVSDGEPNSVVMKWNSNASVNGNNPFEIQRSFDGITFETIGNIAVSGDQNSYNTYTYTDYQPIDGIGYYRVKQSNELQETVFSEILSVETQIGTLEVHVLSHENSLVIRNNTSQQGDLKIEVISLSGTIILAKDITVSSSSDVTIDNVINNGGLMFIRIENLNSSNPVEIHKATF